MLKSVISSFKICFQNYGQFKRKFWRPKHITSSTFLKFELDVPINWKCEVSTRENRSTTAFQIQVKDLKRGKIALNFTERRLTTVVALCMLSLEAARSFHSLRYMILDQRYLGSTNPERIG